MYGYSPSETAYERVPIAAFLQSPRKRRVRRGRRSDAKLPLSPTETLLDSSSSESSDSSATTSPSSTRAPSPTPTLHQPPLPPQPPQPPPPNAWNSQLRLLLPPRARAAPAPVKFDHLSLRECNFPPRAKFFQDQVVWDQRVPCLSGIVFGPPICQERGTQYRFVPRNLCVHAAARGFQSIW